ncbi:uncharacterized protein [Lepisosteus oculatus]|uniref:uncharacterized protein isoform X2 n=1 Tax=Lepisosteus oculatus TaxID=7918 RepID=UPI0037117C5E
MFAAFRSQSVLTVYESDEEDEETQTLSSSGSQGKPYQWMLHDGQQWLNLSHDHIIETHYCQPGAKGITLNTPHPIFLDFDKMEVQGGAQLSLLRHNLLAPGDTEEHGWYFFDNRRWYEFGTQAMPNSNSSVCSSDVEQQYNLNPRGSCNFTVGNESYCLNFTTMTQTNLSTGTQRRVRRRPKLNSVVKRKSSLAGSVQVHAVSSPPAGGWTWEFQGDEGVWTEYGLNSGSGAASSVSSRDVERSYQQNPQGQMQFTAGRFSYILDFLGMVQINCALGTRRSVRRVQRTAQHTVRMPSLSLPVPPSTGHPVWEFRGDEGVWIEYNTGSGAGLASSVSSDDIERNYQQNPHGQVHFTAGKYSYILDFPGMFQKNNSYGTKRDVRRTIKGTSSASSFSAFQTSVNTNCSWQFKDVDGTWNEYVQSAAGGGSSVSCDDIERSYLQNPTGTLNFSAGLFNYILDFSAMTQTNLITGTTRQVRRLQP